MPNKRVREMIEVKDKEEYSLFSLINIEINREIDAAFSYTKKKTELFEK